MNILTFLVYFFLLMRQILIAVSYNQTLFFNGPLKTQLGASKFYYIYFFNHIYLLFVILGVIGLSLFIAGRVRFVKMILISGYGILFLSTWAISKGIVHYFLNYGRTSFIASFFRYGMMDLFNYLIFALLLVVVFYYSTQSGKERRGQSPMGTGQKAREKPYDF